MERQIRARIFIGFSCTDPQEAADAALEKLNEWDALQIRNTDGFPLSTVRAEIQSAGPCWRCILTAVGFETVEDRAYTGTTERLR